MWWRHCAPRDPPVALSARQGAHPPVPAFRYAADIVDLARLIPPWNQAQIGADVSRATDAGRIVDRSHKGESGQLADAWDRHQPAAGRRGPRHVSHVSVDRSDRRHHGGPRRNQTTHGGGETSDPLACSKSVVDEGGGEG